MSNHFNYDPAEYSEKVSRIAEHVVANDCALPTIAPRIDFESNSYHGAAIKKDDRDRLSKAYPRLHH